MHTAMYVLDLVLFSHKNGYNLRLGLKKGCHYGMNKPCTIINGNAQLFQRHCSLSLATVMCLMHDPLLLN